MRNLAANLALKENAETASTLGKEDLSEILDFVLQPGVDLTESMVANITTVAIFDEDEGARRGAQKAIGLLLSKKPGLEKKILAAAKSAMQDTAPLPRKAAQQMICILIEKCPDIIDPALIDATAKIIATDQDKQVRLAAQHTLEALAWSVAC